MKCTAIGYGNKINIKWVVVNFVSRRILFEEAWKYLKIYETYNSCSEEKFASNSLDFKAETTVIYLIKYVCNIYVLLGTD